MNPTLSLLATPGASAGGPLSTASVTDRTVDTRGIGAAAYYSILNNGNIDDSNGNGAEAWLLTGVPSDFEVRFTYNSGDGLTSGDALGVWLPCSSSRTWALSANPGEGVRSTNNTVAIRRVSDLVVLDTATIILTTENFV